MPVIPGWMEVHTLVHMMGIWVNKEGGVGWGGRNKKRISCIYSCRAATPGAEQYACATQGEGCGCSAPQLEAAGGSAPRRSGPSFHKTPEEWKHRGSEWNHCWQEMNSAVWNVPSDPVVSSLVFVVDPVECFIRAVLKAVLGDPLVGVAAALSQDPGHDLLVPQVDLQPLGVVLKLGEPGTPAEWTQKLVPVQKVYSTRASDSTKSAFLCAAWFFWSESKICVKPW